MENQKKTSGKKWVVVLCIVLALVLIGGGAALTYHFIFNSPEKKYEKAMSSAAELMEEEEYKSAIESYKEALEYEEDDEDALEGISEAYKKLGDSYLEKEDYEKAYSNYKKAFKDVENKEAMDAALKLCYDQAAKTYEEYDYTAFEEWAKKHDELADEMDKDDFITAYMYASLDPEVNQPVVEEPEWEEPEVEEPEVVDPEDRVIDVWAFTDEVPKIIDKYVETHPDFPYEIRTTIIATTDGLYQPALRESILAGDEYCPDIFCVEDAFAEQFINGHMGEYVATYKELGIDVKSKIREADIASYVVEVGTRDSDGEIVALGYESSGGAFIYRRSIAREVWGTDDPSIIREKIGSGSGTWDYFWAAAEELKSKGYPIVAGYGDIWRLVENSADSGWIVDGKLHIDPKRESYLDMAKKLQDEGYTNNASEWFDEWFDGIDGDADVFGFFGPTWFINYTMEPFCKGVEGTYGDWAVCESPVGFYYGGTWLMSTKDSPVKEVVGDILEWITLDCTENGFQYMWANGNAYLGFEEAKPMAVTSGQVMRMADGTNDFLAGQNIFDVYIPASAFPTGVHKTEYDETINSIWKDVVAQYVNGNYTREQAIEEFKSQVYYKLGIEAE